MSWAIWITGLPGSGKSTIAQAAAAKLRARGESVIVLELDRIRKVITPKPTDSDAESEAVYRALVYMAAALVDANVPVIVDAPADRRAWRVLARESIPNFAEVQLRGRAVSGGDGEYEDAHAPELTIDTAVQTVAEAADAVVRVVPRTVRHGVSGSRSLGDGELGRQLRLEEGDSMQKAIGRRAFVYTAKLLSDVATRADDAAGSWAGARERMVERQIAGRGVHDPAVLRAMRKVPREAFVPRHLAGRAYDDEPLPIGDGQTISQPYIVARMTEAVRLRPDDRVLEIGTGSGYAAAVLAEIALEVYTVERLATLATSAKRSLGQLGYVNVYVRHGDGSLGWAEHAPYDAIVVTAGGPDIPPSLLTQLAPGGRLVMPVGSTPRFQRLVRVVRAADGTYEREEFEDVAFVPLIGAEGWDAAGAEIEWERRRR